MLARISTLFLFSAALVAAEPWGAPAPPSTTTSQCNTGSLQCCNSVQSSKSVAATTVAGILGVVLDPVEALVGLTCSPIVGILSPNSCAAQPVCCTGNSFSGLLVLGCSPVSL